MKPDNWKYFQMMMPKIASKFIPKPLMDCLTTFLARYPNDMVELTLALSMTLVWCRLKESVGHGLEKMFDSKDPDRKIEVPRLAVFLLYANHFIRFHEEQKLSAYGHIFRFVNKAYSRDMASDARFLISYDDIDQTEVLKLVSVIGLQDEDWVEIVPASWEGTKLAMPRNHGEKAFRSDQLTAKLLLPDVYTMGLPSYVNVGLQPGGKVLRLVYVHRDWATPAVLRKPVATNIVTIPKVNVGLYSQEPELWTADRTEAMRPWRNAVNVVTPVPVPQPQPSPFAAKLPSAGQQSQRATSKSDPLSQLLISKSSPLSADQPRKRRKIALPTQPVTPVQVPALKLFPTVLPDIARQPKPAKKSHSLKPSLVPRRLFDNAEGPLSVDQHRKKRRPASRTSFSQATVDAERSPDTAPQRKRKGQSTKKPNAIPMGTSPRSSIDNFMKTIVAQLHAARESGHVSPDVELGNDGLTWEGMPDLPVYGGLDGFHVDVAKLATDYATMLEDRMSGRERAILKRIVDRDFAQGQDVAVILRGAMRQINVNDTDLSKSAVIKVLEGPAFGVFEQWANMVSYGDGQRKEHDPFTEQVLRPCCVLLGIEHDESPESTIDAITKVDGEVGRAISTVGFLHSRSNDDAHSHGLIKCAVKLVLESKKLEYWRRLALFYNRIQGGEFDAQDETAWTSLFGEPYDN
ncbi:hypothetical protein C8034_v009333 [Colletotrichum sidae]|uniref:Uncharacterized protein n=1 Tax=Colletotrichum sidae TaxID=1347389 RepID=A0A4V3I3N7_9PEZI|nr:hypothetical protein C8034_v009333 [Colletotrichum sidae]